MTLPIGALNTYCATIFETGSRTLGQFKSEWQEELIQHAVFFKQYPLATFDKTLKAGRITQEEYDRIVALMPVPPEPTNEQEPGDEGS